MSVFFTLALIPHLSGQLTDPPNPQSFIYAIEKKIYSQLLMEERSVFISLPTSYFSSPESAYPVVYVTDGDWHIQHLSGIIRFLSGNGIAPECILVAIPHSNRDNDLVPSANTTGSASGHADLFLNFIVDELIPGVEAEYRTQPFRVLAGHSYGGLFTTYAMLSPRRNVFNGYVAADPSLWWDGRRMIREAETLFTNEPSFAPSYYFDQSNLQSMGGVQMAEMLEQISNSSLKWEFVRMEQETHGTIVHKSFYNGLEFVFDDWPFQPVTLSPEGGLFMPGESLEVEMTHARSTEGVIRYTLDGTNPTSDSPVYEHPLLFSENTILRASLFLADGKISPPTEGRYLEAILYPSVEPDHALVAGLNYERFSGEWRALPDFSHLIPVEHGIKVAGELYQWRGLDNFALRYTGYFLAEKDGIYGFELSSDDGSRLIIDGQVLIDNDGLHDVTSVKAWVWLQQGHHLFELQYFELGGGEHLSLTYQRPGYQYFGAIPNRLYFH